MFNDVEKSLIMFFEYQPFYFVLPVSILKRQKYLFLVDHGNNS